MGEDEHDMGALFNYGRFLCEDKNDHAAGIEMYKRALVEEPNDIDTLGMNTYKITQIRSYQYLKFTLYLYPTHTLARSESGNGVIRKEQKF